MNWAVSQFEKAWATSRSDWLLQESCLANESAAAGTDECEGSCIPPPPGANPAGTHVDACADGRSEAPCEDGLGRDQNWSGYDDHGNADAGRRGERLWRRGRRRRSRLGSWGHEAAGELGRTFDLLFCAVTHAARGGADGGVEVLILRGGEPWLDVGCDQRDRTSSVDVFFKAFVAGKSQ